MSRVYNWNENCARLAGRLTADPKFIKYDDSQNRCIFFTLAVNRFNRRSDGSLREETLFMDVQAWNGMADVMKKFLRKGAELEITGHLESYVDKQDRRNMRLVAEGFKPGPNTFGIIQSVNTQREQESVATTTSLNVSEGGDLNYNQ